MGQDEEQTVDPMNEYDPITQFEHKTVPVTEEYVFAAQLVHFVAAVVEYVPAVHAPVNAVRPVAAQ